MDKQQITTFEEQKNEYFSLFIQDTPLLNPEMKKQILRQYYDYRNQSKIFYEFNNSLNQDQAKRYHSNTGNGLFDAIQASYALHTNLVLSADDLWLSVCNNLSHHINNNSEKYRHFFVDHEGKKELRVVLPDDKFIGFPKKENRWDIITELLSDAIKDNTKGNISSLMSNNFSKSTLIDRVGSQICLMSTMKKYFGYFGNIPGCGIQTIYFRGGVTDFTELYQKIQQLIQQCVEYNDQQLMVYLNNVEEIFKKILDQISNNKADVEFWNQIIDQEQTLQRIGSGMSTKVKYTGWIVKLFGLFNENKDFIDKNEIPSFSSEAPVKIIDLNQGGKEFNFKFSQNFYGFEEVAHNTLKPISNISVTLKD